MGGCHLIAQGFCAVKFKCKYSIKYLAVYACHM